MDEYIEWKTVLIARLFFVWYEAKSNLISSVMCFAYMKAISKCEYRFIVV